MKYWMLLILMMLASCGGNSPTTTIEQAKFHIVVPFTPEADNASVATVAGGCWNHSLPIIWHNPPANTKSFAVMLYAIRSDTKADFTYALMYNIAANRNKASEIAGEGIIWYGDIGKNGYGMTDLGSPCPSFEVYEEKQATLIVYALDLEKLAENLNRADFEAAINGHILATAERTIVFTSPTK